MYHDTLGERQNELYNNLMKLCEETETFYFVDQELEGTTYRVFSYRLGSYTEFCKPDALECRGHMFQMYDGQPVRLAVWPMQKFFNDGENPMTMGLDYHNPKQVMVKMDGSLISSFVHYSDAGADSLRLKSKTSLKSQQAVDAMNWLEKNFRLKNEIWDLSELNYTVNMEWVSPNNRIVIGYEEPKLVVLNVRDNLTGEYVSKDDAFLRDLKEVQAHWVETLDVSDPVQFVKDIAGMTGIEGFVIELASGQFVKVKAEAYVALHRTKDSINSPRRLFEACVLEASDDLKSLFHDDPLAMKQITEMEELVSHNFNHVVATVERFYAENKHLERKDYAIKGQVELDKKVFSLAMNLYLGKEVDYKAWMIKHYKDFGVKDDEVQTEE